jgi:hypothetical protein
MSRRRRKTPITGITKSESDTRDKVLAHRCQRRQVRTALASGVAEVITRRKAGDVWSVAKDGKQRFDPRRWPKLMRTRGARQAGHLVRVHHPGRTGRALALAKDQWRGVCQCTWVWKNAVVLHQASQAAVRW